MAPVVVDLISSSPAPKQPWRPPSTASVSDKIIEIDRDDFDFTSMIGGLDFSVPELVEKRKLSNDESDPPRMPGCPSKPIDLSDEEIVLPVPKRSNISVNIRSAAATADLRMPDAIEFTSSAPEARRGKKKAANIFDISDDLQVELPDIANFSFPSLSQSAAESCSKGALSERTANLLANLDRKPSKRDANSSSKFRRKNATLSNSLAVNQIGDIDDILSASPEKEPGVKPRKSKLAEAKKDAKAIDRAATKFAKEAEKEAEKEQRRLARQQKAQEKQKASDIAEVNKSKTDKKESVKEMILDMPSSLKTTSIGNQVEAYMENLEAKFTYYEEGLDLSGESRQVDAVGNIVKWRRKIEGIYDPELDHFQPLAQKRVEKEKHILVHITGNEFAALAARQTDNTIAPISEAAMKANLDAHVHTIKRKHKDCTPIYLIEGLHALIAKNKNAKNRAYQAAARAVNINDDNTTSTAAPSASQPNPKRRKQASAPDVSFFDQALTSSLLLHLQLTHSPHIHIHHVTSPQQSAHWISTFTTHLSTRPYRLHRLHYNLAHANFCMDSGQVKTGTDAQDTYIHMLQELPRVTVSMAHGIKDAGWGSVSELVKGFRREGREMLADVRKAVNRDGAVSERRVGPAVSKRLYRVFMGEDPEEEGI